MGWFCTISILRGCGSHERKYFQKFPPWDFVMVLKALILDSCYLRGCSVTRGLILDNYHFGMMCKFWTYWFWILFTSGGCGGLSKFSINGWFSFAKSQHVELQIVVCVCCVCVYVCVSVVCHKGQSFGQIHQWPTQLIQSGCIIIIVSVGIIVFSVQHCLLCGWCQWVNMLHIYWHTFLTDA